LVQNDVTTGGLLNIGELAESNEIPIMCASARQSF
jgi:hypothetical protein